MEGDHVEGDQVDWDQVGCESGSLWRWWVVEVVGCGGGWL